MFARIRRLGWGLLALLGLAGVLAGVPWYAWRAHVESRWPVVDGRVREVRVQGRHARMSVPRYEVLLTYEYEVGGALRTGRTWAAGHELWCWTEAGAEERARELAPGTPVTVHYDPGDPDDAVLVLEAGRDALFWAGVGSLWMLMGVAGWRRKRPEPVSRF